MRAWFTHQKMTWGKVILLAIGTAVLTAVLKILPVFNNTSFQDIAVNLDCWFLFAVFIIVNCETWKEAVLKTFVFFLISQPLIYLIQVPFSSFGFGLFSYYKYWFVITLLTIPGAFIAFQIKRKNWLSVAVLSVAIGYLAVISVKYFWSLKTSFPHHLISMLFCLALALFFIFVILDRKSHRIVALAVMLVCLVVSLIVTKPNDVDRIELEEGVWTYTVDHPEITKIEQESDNTFIVTAKSNGVSIVTFTKEDGTIAEYCISVSGGGLFISTFD